MKFVPVRGTGALFCIHETRRQDYAAYASSMPGIDSSWERATFNGAPSGYEDRHPVVHVSWNEARAFCAWLSTKEGRTFRLPTDMEWSLAVGLGALERRGAGSTPEMLNEMEITRLLTAAAQPSAFVGWWSRQSLSFSAARTAP